MLKTIRIALALGLLVAAPSALREFFNPVPAYAQSNPGWSYGYIPTAAEWNAALSAKQDYLGQAPCLLTGCTFSGEIVTTAPTTASAGFNLQPGTAPSSPSNGDMWMTGTGLFAFINGSTVGPINSGSSFPGGSNTNYQFNNSSAFGGSTTLTHSGSTDTASGTFNVTGTFEINGTAETFPSSGLLVGTTDTQSLTSKTLTSNTNVLGGVTMTLGSDATGDIYYRNSSGFLTRLGIGSSGQALEVVGGLPAWASISGTGTVTSVTTTAGTGLGSTGTCTSTTVTTCTLNITNPVTATAPTTQTFLTGGSSGTYTTPAGVKSIEIAMVGGGGGGSSGCGSNCNSGGNGGNTCWNTSGAACTTPVYQAGGGTGAPIESSTGGAGGTVSGSGTCLQAIGGSAGNVAIYDNSMGGAGGPSFFGGAGAANSQTSTAGGAGVANTGGGGGGASSGTNDTDDPGSGGGAGAYCRVIINSPAGTYTYAVGAAGTGANGGGAPHANGGTGGTGGIWVIEHYNY